MRNMFSKPLAVGSKAPDFTTADSEGNKVSLANLRGKNVVLVFYPGDDTYICTKQLCEFRDYWGDAQKSNTVVFGVNPADAGSHEAFRGKHQFPFPILVDEGRTLAKFYKCSGLVVKRTVYLIGPDGTVRYAMRGKPAVDEVLKAAVVNSV